MDMARAILERVAEVELQITPEFQKPTSGGKYELMSLEAALKKNGWQEGKGDLVAPDVKISTWTHLDLPGVTIEVTYDWKRNVLHSDTISVEKGGGPATTHPATPEMVGGLTDEWKTEVGLGRAEKQPHVTVDQTQMPEVQVELMLEQFGWIVAMTKEVQGQGETTYVHPKVEEAIRVRAEENGDLVSAVVVQPDGSWDAFEPNVGLVYQKAQELMKKAGA